MFSGGRSLSRRLCSTRAAIGLTAKIPTSPTTPLAPQSRAFQDLLSFTQFKRNFQSASIHHNPNTMYGTTILCVRKNNKVVMIGDGQVTQGAVIIKPNAKKVRRLGQDRSIIAGFAGSTADAMTLFERLEQKLDAHRGQLLRSCVELATAWRTDKYLRRLEAIMIVADKDLSLTLTGTGDVLEHPKDGAIAVGSGGGYALAAARALVTIPELEAEEVAKRAMQIAADICVYTNSNFTVETIDIAKS
eukprot:TRINITY_DN5184_c0_g1_i2.p1 TRINITY_DN5184_c0_g1~~TRINITY_DN5184_c0_g1_i2.p1  ORF type:complete len:246 (+),score=19.83 TRINITY_DN5184_c0_g1_i2:98-835(+)